MSNPAIEISDLGKRYRIGERINTHQTLTETITNSVSSIWRRGKGSASSERKHDDGGRHTIWALRHVSFDIRQGEVMGLIGPNGAGKSTMLKLLASITKPTEGEVRLYGHVGALLEVGTGFHPELTGRENIFLNGAILGMTRREIQNKFDQIVDFSEVEQFIDTPVKHYSSGMYMRLAFSVAAHLDPEILLIDEVLAVGDAAFQKKCLTKMESVAGEGRTVVFVSHNLAAVQSLCHRTALFERDKPAIVGPTEEIISRYLGDIIPAESSEIWLPPANGTDPGVGRRLLSCDLEGVPSTQFRLGQSWNIVFEFDIRQELVDVVAAVQLVTVRGVAISAFESQPATLRAGQYAVSFVCELPLRPDHYQFNVFLHSEGRIIYHASGVGHIEIGQVVKQGLNMRVQGQSVLAHIPKGEIRKLRPGEARIEQAELRNN